LVTGKEEKVTGTIGGDGVPGVVLFPRRCAGGSTSAARVGLAVMVEEEEA